MGFQVGRAASPTAPVIQWTLLTPGLILAQGQPAAYNYVDSTAEAGQAYYYRLKVVYSSGASETSGWIPGEWNAVYLPVIWKGN